MSERVKKIINVIQWLIICILSIVCIYVTFFKKDSNTSQGMTIQQENTYIKTYESKKIKALEKENKALYDSIKALNNLESAIEIKYVYKYDIDTIYVPSNINSNDSVYNYTYDNDTLKYNLTIKAKELKWHKADFELHDKFTIINTEDNNKVTTIINHSPNVNIEDVTAWHKKNVFWDNVYYGPSVSIGYGVFNNKPDVFIGFSIGWNINK